jgi:NAD(P)H-hydrate epimerase
LRRSSRLAAAAASTSHKGDHGKLVIIGGDRGTAGAIRMAVKRRCARRGLVRVLTHKENIAPIVTADRN